jgi:hypothetical protein
MISWHQCTEYKVPYWLYNLKLVLTYSYVYITLTCWKLDDQSIMTEICWNKKMITLFMKTSKQYCMGLLYFPRFLFFVVSSSDIIKRWLYKQFNTGLELYNTML